MNRQRTVFDVLFPWLFCLTGKQMPQRLTKCRLKNRERFKQHPTANQKYYEKQEGKSTTSSISQDFQRPEIYFSWFLFYSLTSIRVVLLLAFEKFKR